jgi:hypothetical protein
VIVSFTDYTPTPRYDDQPWTSVTIEEGPEVGGPWTVIDTITLAPVDDDPANPIARSFTTNNATIPDGWYRVSFVDDNSNVLATQPIQNVGAIEWRPTLKDVGVVCLARTRDQNGIILRTFNDNTVPSGDDVELLISEAVNDLRPRVGTDIPDDLIQEAQHITALRTAMYIELTYFSNEVSQNRSPYPQYKELYDEKVPILSNAISAEESGLAITDAVGGSYPSYSFPAPATSFFSDPF